MATGSSKVLSIKSHWGYASSEQYTPHTHPHGQRYSTEGRQDMSNGNSHHRVAGGV